MKAAGIIIILGYIFVAAMSASAQSATPTPSPTQPPTYTPIPTYGWPTLTPIPPLSLTPKPWPTPTPPVPGQPFNPGPLPTFPAATPQPGQPYPQLTALSDTDVLTWFTIITVYTIGFWLYLYVNFPMLILAGRLIALLLFMWRIAMRLTKRFKQLREE